MIIEVTGGDALAGKFCEGVNRYQDFPFFKVLRPEKFCFAVIKFL